MNLKDYRFSSEFEVANVKLAYQRPFNIKLRPKISMGAMAAEIFQETWDKETIELQEQFKAMFLTVNYRVLAISELSSGGTTEVIADARILFSLALLLNAKNIIIAHNHPDGECVPSKTDIRMTKILKQGAALLDLSLSDHMILTRKEFFSMKEEGLI